MSRNSQLDLVLVHPGTRMQVYQSLGSKLAAIEPPVWASLLATFVRKHGFSVQIVDAEAENLTPEETATRIEEMDPLLAVIVVYGHQPSASTQNMTVSGLICDALKELNPESQISAGGRTRRGASRTYVAGGIGGFRVHRRRTLYSSSICCKPQNPHHRIIRRCGESVIGKTALPPPHPQLRWSRILDDEIPELAWDLLPMEKYRAHNWHCFGDLQREPYASFYTTFGCPFHCSFCCIQAPFKTGEKEAGWKESVNSYRFWSAQAVIAQIDKLVNQYGVRNIKIADEMFVLNSRHILGICDAIIERGYDLNIWAYARVDTVKDGMLEKLKRAGFNWLAFGIEAASDRVRDDVDKGFDQEEIFRTLEKVRAADVNVIANYIFGLPEDDLESMRVDA